MKPSGKGPYCALALMLAHRPPKSQWCGAMIIALAVQNLILLATLFLMRDLPDHLEAFFIGF